MVRVAQNSRESTVFKGLRRVSSAGAALILVASCTDAEQGKGSVHTPDFPSTIFSAAPSITPPTDQNPIEKAIHAFGINLNERQVAAIAMNTCVAWTNVLGSLTVTYNPGLVQVLGNGHQHGEVLVWGNRVVTEGYPKPSLIISDGPGVFYDGTKKDDEIHSETLTLYFDKSGDANIDDHVSKRHITSQLSQGEAGQPGYYHDVRTSQPVIRSEIVEGSLDFATITPLCNELRI